MSSAESKAEFLVSRVVAALDAVCQTADAMAAAVDIAARCKVELVGLFIDDDSLFRLASTPAARHLTLTSTGPMTFGNDMLETETRARAARAAAALGAAAGARGVPCSFRLVRGMPGLLLGQATMPGDLIVLPAEASVAGLPLRPHSPLLRAAGAAALSALVVRRPPSFSRPLVVSGAEPALVRRSIAAVRRLRAPSRGAVDVVVPGMTQDAAGRALAGLKDLVRIRALKDPSPRGVLDLAQGLESDVLVLAPDAPPPGEHGFSDELLMRSDRHVLLVRRA